MKNLLLLMLSLPVVLFANKGKEILITVNNFENAIVQKKVTNRVEAKGLEVFAGSFESNLESFIQASRLYQLVDRSQLKDLLTESDFNESGMIGTKATKKFAMQGAGKILFVELKNVEFSTNSQTYNLTNKRDEDNTLILSVAGKVIDITTTKVDYVLPVLRVSLNQSNNQLRKGEKTSTSNIWQDAAEKLAKDMARVLARAIRPAKILAVNGKQVMINQGSTTGFVPGVLVTVYATEVIEDEDTGEQFLNEIPVGTGSVVRGDARKCYIVLTEDLGVVKGCIARNE